MEQQQPVLALTARFVAGQPICMGYSHTTYISSTSTSVDKEPI